MLPVNRRVMMMGGAIAVAFTIILIVSFNDFSDKLVPSSTSSEFVPERSFVLNDILNSDDELLSYEKHKKIFFIESHKTRERKIRNARMACSVESAARINPDMDVYFIFATDASDVNLHYSELLDALLSYENMHFRFLNVLKFSEGTILEQFFRDDRLKMSGFPVEHLSDILRLMVLNKYGGQYLDTDVLSLQPLSVINHENFLCPQDNVTFTNAIMNFNLKEGKIVTEAALKKMNKEYIPQGWADNGPGLISSIILPTCKDGVAMDKTSKCGNMTIFASTKCYPISFPEWFQFFEESFADEVLRSIDEADSYFVHVWNKMQEFSEYFYELSYASQSAYAKLARKNCPKVFSTIKKFI